MADNLFQRQNIYLKIYFVLLLFLIVIFSRFNTVSHSIIINFIIFLPVPNIIVSFLKILLKLSFFWIFYLLSGLLLNVPFEKQLDFLVRIIIMLQVSVFLQKSITFERFMSDTRLFLRYEFFQHIVHFLLYFNAIFEHLINHFHESDLLKSSLKEGLSSNYIKKIVFMIKSIFDKSDEIKDDLPEIPHTINASPPFFTFANLYLFYTITLYTLVLSI